MIVELFESLSVTLQSLSKGCHEMLVASHNPDHCTESTMRQPTRTMCVAVKVGNAHLTLQPGRCKERGGRSWGKGGRKYPLPSKKLTGKQDLLSCWTLFRARREGALRLGQTPCWQDMRPNQTTPAAALKLPPYSCWVVQCTISTPL